MKQLAKVKFPENFAPAGEGLKFWKHLASSGKGVRKESLLDKCLSNSSQENPHLHTYTDHEEQTKCFYFSVTLFLYENFIRLYLHWATPFRSIARKTHTTKPRTKNAEMHMQATCINV